MKYDDEARYEGADDTVVQPDTEEGAGSLPALPSLALGGATLLSVGGFDLLAHLGPTGLLVGGIAAIIAARHGTAIIDGAKSWLTLPVSREEDDDPAPETPPALSRPSRSHRSILDRALGRFPEDEEDVADMPEAWQSASIACYDPYVHRDCLYLGGDLFPHANSVLSKRIALLGMSGSGKSNGLAVFVEALGKLSGIGAPLVLADTDGEYRSLCSRKYLSRPVYAHAGNLSPDNAFQFGQDILEHGYQVILNLQSYDEDEVTAALVMIELIRGLRTWEEAHENEDRLSCLFLLDEAAVWLPQRAEESGLAKERDAQGRTILSRLQRTFFNTVARRGRKQGIGFLFASQRPADLDNRCLSCNWYVLFRQTLPADLEAYRRLGVPKDVAMALSEGEAWVIDPSGKQSAHQFRVRYSPDEGKSPGLASLHQHAARWQETPASPLPPMPELPMRTVPVMPAPEPTPVMEVPKPVRLPALYQRALEVYEPGMTYRELGEVLDVGKDKAGIILQNLKKRGLLASDDEEPDEA